MRISEIIVESKGRRQLDEGMMDTIKSKLSGVYQMARKKYPNFDEVFAVAKSHKAEINDIIEQLKAKKEDGKVSKEDIVAAIMPLSKKVAGEIGGKGVVNENKILGGFTGGMYGAMISPVVWFMGSMLSGGETLDVSNVFFTCVAIGATLVALFTDSPEEEERREERRRASLSPQQLQQREYDSLERFYRNDRHKMTYAQTRRMEELYNQGFR